MHVHCSNNITRGETIRKHTLHMYASLVLKTGYGFGSPLYVTIYTVYVIIIVTFGVRTKRVLSHRATCAVNNEDGMAISFQLLVNLSFYSCAFCVYCFIVYTV